MQNIYWAKIPNMVKLCATWAGSRIFLVKRKIRINLNQSSWLVYVPEFFYVEFNLPLLL